MTPYLEKLLIGFGGMVSSSTLALGAIMTTGELRWIYVTLAVGMMTSVFLTLLLKRPTDTVQVIIGRCGLSIMFSMVGSKLVVHFYKITGADSDVVILSAITMGVCVVGYTLGHNFVRMLARNSEKESSKLFDMVMSMIRFALTKKP